MRKLLLSLLLLLLTWPTLASAHFMGGSVASPPPAGCPMGNAFPDGCPGAQATAVWQQSTAFQNGGFINTVSGTPTNYMANTCGGSGSAGPCRPQWNVAGVDYAIGYYSKNCSTNLATTWTSPSDCLLDPAILSAHGLLPSHCTYTATGNNGGPLLNCTSGWGGILSHMNFGPINSHSCTQVSVNLTSAAPIVMDDFYFQNDSGLCGNSQGFALVISGSPIPATTPVLSNFVMDGNSTTYSTRYGPASCISTLTACNARQAIFSDALVMKYGVVENFAADPINVATIPQTGQTLIEYCVITGWNDRAPNNHTEWFAGPNQNTTGTPGVVSTEIQYTIAIAATNTSTFGPGMIFILSGFPVSIGPVVLQNNVVVNQWAGGLTANSVAYEGCRGATFVSAGPPAICSGTGAKFFLTSGQAGWGTGLIGCGVNGNLGPPVSGTPPPGVIAVFWIDNGGVSSGYGDTGGNDQAAASCSGNFSTASAGDTAFVSGYGPHPAASISNVDNFIDASSYNTATPNLYIWGQNPTTTNTSVTFLSTTTMTSTQSLNGLNNDTYISGTGLCPGDLTTCPFIPTGGSYSAGTTITINPNGTTPSGTVTNVTIGEATICTTPITYSGNVDMAGLASSAYMNQNTRINGNVGC